MSTDPSGRMRTPPMGMPCFRIAAMARLTAVIEADFMAMPLHQSHPAAPGEFAEGQVRGEIVHIQPFGVAGLGVTGGDRRHFDAVESDDIEAVSIADLSQMFRQRRAAGRGDGHHSKIAGYPIITPMIRRHHDQAFRAAGAHREMVSIRFGKRIDGAPEGMIDAIEMLVGEVAIDLHHHPRIGMRTWVVAESPGAVPGCISTRHLWQVGGVMWPPFPRSWP
ncbi:hypothetical protein L2U69_12050 [Zavarzinia compransoris]|uniref:hypothetical protein n=1 Tax=Zavarzinia marina TaxID=2911065 RepID=UPI001F36EA47|nr:hypothetical protein [Zavarzinia marina]MCF4166379.1 hypothetical protein [Zavarzinia marina]